MRYRANCYDSEQLDSAIELAANSAQVEAAIKLLSPIIEDYTNLLAEEETIDFDDMIGKAIQYVKSGQFRSRWKFILVDEFQDISEPRARLISSLRDSARECSVFCVGDDWQAIYRFTGSDISYITQFENFFGATRISALDLTFRFNESISDVSARFILENSEQVSKRLESLHKTNQPEISLLRADSRTEHNSINIDYRIEIALFRINSIANKGSQVFLLGRYGFNLPDKSQLKILNNQFSNWSDPRHSELLLYP